MRPLPYDWSRCQPTTPAAKCQTCVRWIDVPGQTMGPRQPIFIDVDPETNCHGRIDVRERT